jgi:plasmid stabilization system protein ParE
MTESYVLTLHALNDLAEKTDRIASESGPARAESVMARIGKAFELVAEQPGIGHVREDLTEKPMLRFWKVFSYLIVYSRGTPSLEPVVIVRIIHGARGPELLRRQLRL